MAHNFPAVPDLVECLRRLIAQMPPGRVATRGDLAEALGNPIAARWVGHFLAHHQHGDDCACHRIVMAGGELGQYAGGSMADKAKKLAGEGVVARQGKIDLDQCRFRDFRSDRPLEKLRLAQEAIRGQIVIRPRRRMPKYVAGVDVAYPNAAEGQAAYALVETATAKLVWSAVVRRAVRFPYITSYLSFREIPILLELFDEVRAARRMAEIVLVDGTGILHPRQAGIASHLGLAASVATVGVTKKLLCGRVDMKDMLPGESRPVIFDDQPLGIALRPNAGGKRPIFISPGHGLDLDFSEKLVRLLLAGRRLPEPIYWADRLSKKS